MEMLFNYTTIHFSRQRMQGKETIPTDLKIPMARFYTYQWKQELRL